MVRAESSFLRNVIGTLHVWRCGGLQLTLRLVWAQWENILRQASERVAAEGPSDDAQDAGDAEHRMRMHAEAPLGGLDDLDAASSK